MEKIEQLDGLRGYAVVLVLLAHMPHLRIGELGNIVHQIFQTTRIGYLGVDIFFVLSGFLITSILYREIKCGKNNILKNFYIKRILRIFPIYYLTIFTCNFIFEQHEYIWTYVYLSNYSFSFDFSPHPLRHSWSLAVEEQFYILWPLLLLFFYKNISKVILSIIVISISTSLLKEIFLSEQISNALIYRSLESRMLSLSLGAYMAIRGVPKIRERKLFTTTMTLFGILALASLVNKAYGIYVFQATLQQVCFSLISCSIFILCFNSVNMLNSFFTNESIKYIGKISYGLYLYHLPIFYYFGISHMQTKDTVSLSTFSLAIGLTFLVTISTFKFIELPLINLRKYLVREEQYTLNPIWLFPRLYKRFIPRN